MESQHDSKQSINSAITNSKPNAQPFSDTVPQTTIKTTIHFNDSATLPSTKTNIPSTESTSYSTTKTNVQPIESISQPLTKSTGVLHGESSTKTFNQPHTDAIPPQQTTKPMTQHPKPVSVSNTDSAAQNRRKPIISPISPLSSYKGIIIAICVGILLWMLLQRRDHKSETKDTLSKHRENAEITLDKTKESIKNKIYDTNENIKTTYDQTAENIKSTIKNAADKTKSKYDESVGSMQETKESLKDKLNDVKENIIGTTKETIDTIKQKSQQTMENVKQQSSATIDSIKGQSQQTVESVKSTSGATMDKAKETIDSLIEKSQQTYENVKQQSGATIDKAKDTFSKTQADVEYRLTMDGLIEQAQLTLQEFLSPHLKIEESIPVSILSGAKAVVFLTVVKGGIGISGVFGSGIVIARNEIGHWSGPCAIALAGVDIGLNIGMEKSDHIIILRDDAAVRAFASKGQFKLGIDASVSVGPKGRDASIGLSVGEKGYATTVSYSMATGAYLGLSFEGALITIRNDCNEQYYGKKVDSIKILEGKVKAPKNKPLNTIYKIIDEYTAKNLVYPAHHAEL